MGSDRVLAVLKELSRYPDGVGLDELTRAIGSPKPTVHRALGALRRAGLADQDARGHYMLGDEFLRMAFAHHEARPEHVRIRPLLETLAARFGETAHYAVLDGREVVYRA
ncbi:helix-turn-helix domain-containing protein [Microbispora sp. KK1-11]|uniref:helix-turn-helix domain-containing protein n=1 Tax=Microbispora sp. KK1-11 TaxID=2053005 RepID=UPI0021AE4BA5|nr:helix-turn-helix domain-containing protein [Microbispora sp. KK1-11]